MSDDKPYTRCPYCREIVEPDDPESVYAVEQRELKTFGPKLTIADGMGAFFHPTCPPESVGYARRSRP